MPELTSMKKEPKNYQEEKQSSVLKHDGDQYPHGLCIYLGKEEMEKLSMQGMPRIGDRMYMKAFVEVKSIEKSDSEYEGEEREVGLQITHMDLKIASEEQAPESVFYGNPTPPRIL